MSETNDTKDRNRAVWEAAGRRLSGPRSNRNPILREFRRTRSNSLRARVWAQKLTGAESPSWWWLLGATVSEQVFAARVLYRYAGVFSS